MLHPAIALMLFQNLTAGTWRAHLDAPHGPLNFPLIITAQEGGFAAVVCNGTERIDVPVSRKDDGDFVFAFAHYNASLTARLDDTGRSLDGEWRKRSGAESESKLPFHARWWPEHVRPEDIVLKDGMPPVSGRWRVRFAQDPDDAVAILRGGGDTLNRIVAPFSPRPATIATSLGPTTDSSCSRVSMARMRFCSRPTCNLTAR